MVVKRLESLLKECLKEMYVEMVRNIWFLTLCLIYYALK